MEYQGRIVPAIEALHAEGMEPAILGPKDGLSIVSSNAQGESLVVLLVKESEELIRMSNAIYCLHLEGLNGGLQPLGERVNEVRGLPGQIRCAAECRRFLKGSYLEHPDPKRALQDPLSFRCGAAVNGSVCDALEFVKQYLSLMINRTDDNPCILYEEAILAGCCYLYIAVYGLIQIEYLLLPVVPSVYMVEDRSMEHILVIQLPGRSASFAL